MGYIFLHIVCNSSLMFHLKHFQFDNDAISILAQQKHLMLKLSLVIFLKFLPFELHYSKTCTLLKACKKWLVIRF